MLRGGGAMADDDWNNHRLHNAMEMALKVMGLDPWDYPAGCIVPAKAAALCMSMVKSVERLAAEHGATNENYPMYESKGQAVVVLHGVLRFRKCNVCKIWHFNKKRWCGGCRNRTYCGRQCQKADWPSHKADCGITLQLETEVRSMEGHYYRGWVNHWGDGGVPFEGGVGGGGPGAG